MKLFVVYKFRWKRYADDNRVCNPPEFSNDIIEYESNIDSIGDISRIEDIIGERNKDHYYIVLIDWKVLEN